MAPLGLQSAVLGVLEERAVMGLPVLPEVGQLGQPKGSALAEERLRGWRAAGFLSGRASVVLRG